MTTQGKPPAREETQASENSRPVLKLIKGNATEEEIAALVSVLSALGETTEQTRPSPKSQWSAHHRKVRVTLRHGPGAWGASGLPR